MPSLQEKYARNFTEEARIQGEALAAKAVRVWGGDERIECEFPQEEHQTAGFLLQERRLHPHCQCPTFTEGHRLCPHLWAAILLAGRFEDLNAAMKRNVPSKISIENDAGNDAGEPTYEKEKARPARIEGHEDEEGRIIVPDPAARAKKRPQQPEPTIPVEEAPSLQILYVIRPDKREKPDLIPVDTWWRPADATQPARPFVIEDGTTAPTPLDSELLNRMRPFKSSPSNRHQIPASLTEYFDSLAMAPRLRWADTSGGTIRMRPLQFPLTRTAEFSLNVSFTGDARFQITPILRLAGESIPFSRVQMVADGGRLYGYALTDGRLLRVAFQGAGAAIAPFAGSESRILDYAEALAFSRRIALESSLDTSAFPEAIAMHGKEGVPAGELYVRTAKYKYKEREQLHAVLSFNYDGVSCPDDSSEKVAAGRAVITRNPELEERLRERLRALGFRYNTKAYLEELGWKLLPAELDSVVHTLVGEGWNITAEGKTYRKPVTRQATSSSGQDWFELKAGVSFDGQEVPLPALLAAYKAGSKTVRLDDGTFGLLPMEWLANFTVLTELGEVSDDRVRFRLAQASLVSAILEERLEENSRPLQEQLQEYAKLSNPRPAIPAPGFNATLREYQAIGLGWLENMQRAGLGACLADDMGLGKTIQVLALLHNRPRTAPPSLVVLPKSLIFNWLDEIRKFTPDLTVIVHTGSDRSCSPRRLSEANIVLTTYGTLRNDATRLASFQFDYCILDESQAIKNHDSSTAQAARCIRAAHRLTMTGTPIENNLGELFSQLDFLNPGLFGRQAFAVAPSPDNRREDSLVNRIRRGVRPFILRRTKEEVAKELPPKTEQTVWCQLSEQEQQEYDELLRYYQKQLLEEGSASGGMQALAALTRLRQAACHPGLIKESRSRENSAKLETLLASLESIIPAGHKALVFSQFTSFLKIIRRHLEELGHSLCYLDGTTPDRAEVVKEFQDNPEKRIFLISLKAGGVGLNLTAADYVFIMDPWWNPATEAQAIDRAYRIGQTQPVMAYRIAAKNTIEEKVLRLQEAKRSLANAIIHDTGELPEGLSLEDIRDLIRQ